MASGILQRYFTNNCSNEVEVSDTNDNMKWVLVSRYCRLNSLPVPSSLCRRPPEEERVPGSFSVWTTTVGTGIDLIFHRQAMDSFKQFAGKH